MKSPARNIKMTSYDDLFNPVAQQDSGEKIVYLPLSELHTPKIHPFKVRDFGHYHENRIIDQKYILQWEKISELSF